jgi:hypothetical protein
VYSERFRDIDEAAFEQEYPFKNIRYTQGEIYELQEQEQEPEQYELQEQEQEQEPEQYEQSMSYELQELDKELEFELFSNVIHDTEFEQLLSEVANEAEPKFVNYVGLESPNITELEQALKIPDMENRFDQFFRINYSPMVNRINEEIDRFESYLDNYLQPQMDFETVQEIVDRYQVTEPEELFGKIGKFLKKVGKATVGAIKKVGGIATDVLTAPMKLALKPILAKIKLLVNPLLRKVLTAGLRFIPAKYRDLAQKAAAALGVQKEFEITELETSEPEQEDEAIPMLESEVLGESDLESENMEALQEGLYEESETESFDHELELEEIVREFDRQVFEAIGDKFDEIPISEGYVPIDGEDSMYGYSASIPASVSENEAIIVEDARNRLINGLTGQHNPDIQKLTEDFIPAILPALRFGIKLIGRARVINFIASLAAKVLDPLVGKDLSGPLSKVATDIGLRMLTLEAPETVTRRESIAHMVTNIIGETVERVAELPETILEGEEEVLESFVQDALVESIENNVPRETLKTRSILRRRLPLRANWVHRNKGRFKTLSMVYKLTLDPTVARRIRTGRHGETLLDVLRKYQSWDGKTPVPVTVRIFETVIGTRLSMIAKKYLGGSEPDFVRQIIPLTRSAATLLLKSPLLTSRRFVRIRRGKFRGAYQARRRFYCVKISSTKTAPVQPTKPSVVNVGGNISSPVATTDQSRSPAMQEPTMQEPTMQEPTMQEPTMQEPTMQELYVRTNRAMLRSNDVHIRFIRHDRLECKIYLSEYTVRQIRETAGSRTVPELLKSIEGLLLSNGSRVLQNLFLHFQIPSSIAKEIVNFLLGSTIRHIHKNAAELSSRFRQLQDSPEGITIVITLGLPKKFLHKLPKLKTDNLTDNLSQLFTVTTSAKINVIPMYRL